MSSPSAPSADTVSADQDQWVSLITQVRNKMFAQVQLVPSMTNVELKDFIGAINDAMWAQHQAETFDKRIELAQARLTYSD